jgi:hypothetical protein
MVDLSLRNTDASVHGNRDIRTLYFFRSAGHLAQRPVWLFNYRAAL